MRAYFVKKNPYKFLIINPFGIGDVLFSTPLIRNLKDFFPEAKIYYLCNRRTQPILENHPLIDKIFVYERDEFEEVKKISKLAWLKKFWSFISEIKKENIDIVFDLSLNSQFSFLAWMAGIKERIGYNYKNRGWLLTKKIKFEGYQDKHVIEYYLELLVSLGFEPKHRRVELFLNSQQKDRASIFCSQRAIDSKDLLIAISPGGGKSWGKDNFRRHWDKEKFAKLADKLIEKFKAKVMLCGDSSDKDIIEDIEKLMYYKPLKVIDLPIMDFLALVNKARILIANDGGPVHMAVGLGIKIVSIVGPVDEKVYGPYPEDKNKYIVIKRDLACRPCYRNFRLPECPYNRKCLTEIEIDEVFKAVESLVQEQI